MTNEPTSERKNDGDWFNKATTIALFLLVAYAITIQAARPHISYNVYPYDITSWRGLNTTTNFSIPEMGNTTTHLNQSPPTSTCQKAIFIQEACEGRYENPLEDNT